MALTVSKHFAIPVMMGRGFTEPQARHTLDKASIFGSQREVIGSRVVSISFANDKFTIKCS